MKNTLLPGILEPRPAVYDIGERGEILHDRINVVHLPRYRGIHQHLT